MKPACKGTVGRTRIHFQGITQHDLVLLLNRRGGKERRRKKNRVGGVPCFFFYVIGILNFVFQRKGVLSVLSALPSRLRPGPAGLHRRHVPPRRHPIDRDRAGTARAARSSPPRAHAHTPAPSARDKTMLGWEKKKAGSFFSSFGQKNVFCHHEVCFTKSFLLGERGTKKPSRALQL